MTLKLGPITPEMEESIVAAKKEEDAFWERNGFPEYAKERTKPKVTLPHSLYMETVYNNGPAYSSPMARRMFILGYLTRQDME